MRTMAHAKDLHPGDSFRLRHDGRVIEARTVEITDTGLFDMVRVEDGAGGVFNLSVSADVVIVRRDFAIGDRLDALIYSCGAIESLETETDAHECMDRRICEPTRAVLEVVELG